MRGRDSSGAATFAVEPVEWSIAQTVKNVIVWWLCTLGGLGLCLLALYWSRG